MQAKLNRRTLLHSGLAGGMGFGLLSQILVPTPAHARKWFAPRGAGRFDRLMATTTGAVPAGLSDFAFRLPDGTPAQARLAYPLVVTKRLKVLLFCADLGARASQYDGLIGALAAHNFFVLALDGPPIRDMSKAAGASRAGAKANMARADDPVAPEFLAKARFLLDLVDSAAAALGENAKMVDTERMGAMGHGDGAWMAAALGGWDRNGAASTLSRDGRIHSVLGLNPARSTSPQSQAAQRSPDGVSGMFVGNLAQMPVPARKSGLIGLGLPQVSHSFGGLIGPMEPRNARRTEPQSQALAAATASSILYFDWTLRSDLSSKVELLGLNGRQVAGLSAPLTLRRA